MKPQVTIIYADQFICCTSCKCMIFSGPAAREVRLGAAAAAEPTRGHLPAPRHAAVPRRARRRRGKLNLIHYALRCYIGWARDQRSTGGSRGGC